MLTAPPNSAVSAVLLQQQPQRIDSPGAGEAARGEQGCHPSARGAGGAGGERVQQRTPLQTGDHADG